MDSRDIKSNKKNTSKQAEPQGFFQSLFANLFGSNNPEAELKRRLKYIAKDFNKTKFHTYYRTSTFEATPNFAKLFYDIYKLISPAQLMFHANPNLNAFKHQIINYSLTDRQMELLAHFDEKKIQEMATKIDFDKLKIQIENDLNDFCGAFDDNRINKIENLYKAFVIFRDFCSYDYFMVLKKFNSSIQENLFNEVPQFAKINAEYIVDDLKDFCTVAYPITDDKIVWGDLFEFLKSKHSSEIVGLNNWKKIIARMRSIQSSMAFDLMIRHITRKPNYQVTLPSPVATITEPYLTKIREDTLKTLSNISMNMKHSKANSISEQIFGKKEIKLLRYYVTTANEPFAKKNLPIYKFAEPLNYLKGFLTEYVKNDLREYFDVVVIRGQWAAQMSAPLSNAYQELVKMGDDIAKFDNALSEAGPTGVKIKTLLPKTAHDPGAENIIRRLIDDANEDARTFLVTATQNLVTIGRIMKQLIEDYMKQKPVIVGNWHELEKFIDKPMKDFSVNIYKKIYLFVQLMQQYLSN